ncbi:aminomethyl-transferring glycine dehydrogenase [Bacteroidales bacterium OttesenSCG-928-C19]|nr:aminomethyl-transferring glycine dehydrogenase [Bacteroidales bacterium OttesenSCG-928-C19]
MITNNFVKRHNGPRQKDVEKMLQAIGEKSIEGFIEKTVPASIRLKQPLDLPQGINEYEYLNHIKAIASKNKIFKTYIGMGYYNTITPSVILRNVFENAGWYTAYTPYQAEISQGRLEALLNFQTMISDLTSLPIANASLLDEATAGGEAALMLYRSRTREQQKANVNKLFVAEDVFPQTIAVIKTNCEPQNIEVVVGNPDTFVQDGTYFGAIIQYSNQFGLIRDYSAFVAKAKESKMFVAVAADLMSLTLLTPPGEWGADCVFGTTQRFGVPMGFGGPAAAYFACTDEFKRQIPGRIIGITIDAEGKQAFRMALATREQHIKREKATSNICTASALVAIMAGFYGAYHGPCGLKAIAKNINVIAGVLAKEVEKLGYKQLNKYFFDTLLIEIPSNTTIEKIKEVALAQEVNFRYIDNKHIGISVDETTSKTDIDTILSILAKAAQTTAQPLQCNGDCDCSVETYPKNLARTSEFMTHKVYNTYHSETEMMRYMKKLEIKDLSLNRAMIPLGSCTMKLNAATEMLPLSWAEFGAIHPLVPKDQVEGYYELINNLDKQMSIITGFAKTSFQPNSGAYGEYAGLMTIKRYLDSKGQSNRNICLIPASAHGTNPASAVKAGLEVVIVKSTELGEVDVNDLKAKAEQYKDTLACLMITYPSTHGVFEEAILDIIDTIHANGGQVYMDGANMNGQVGLTSPGFMGADVCHLNLHKTFAMPHGGGGPGVGPISVASHLVDFLPNHPLVETGGKQGVPVAASPFGYAMLLPITYGYVKMLGGEGLKQATEMAMLSANYIRVRLKDHYKILYVGAKGMNAHEVIIDCNEFSLSTGVQVGDIAKRLMDYGFHAPTVAFPVHGTLMIEPTESEPLAEIDRLCDALIAIRQEIREIEEGKADKENNVIRNAPHTMSVVCATEWTRPYSREKAAFPQAHDDKYWPTISKIDDAYGDRNLCPKWEA